MNTMELIRTIKAQLHELTGFAAESVSQLTPTETGWEVVANLVELKRIPASTDLLAAYRITLDKEGNVTSYSRVRRYLRDQLIEETAD
ncbi:hypothetical protein GGQ63_000424 [Prosthecomicrobium pneumaticum]|uniref:Gas vesicle protein n=1 Tax=Prosthecomicrobium pneumaticum TaxID=81895 RepID=A0A7W9CTJ4_9HYPH|nr:hypothetical protein [Prosthecomicrobium pneumaticum]